MFSLPNYTPSKSRWELEAALTRLKGVEPKQLTQLFCISFLLGCSTIQASDWSEFENLKSDIESYLEEEDYKSLCSLIDENEMNLFDDFNSSTENTELLEEAEQTCASHFDTDLTSHPIYEGLSFRGKLLFKLDSNLKRDQKQLLPYLLQSQLETSSFGLQAYYKPPRAPSNKSSKSNKSSYRAQLLTQGFILSAGRLRWAELPNAKIQDEVFSLKINPKGLGLSHLWFAQNNTLYHLSALHFKREDRGTKGPFDFEMGTLYSTNSSSTPSGVHYSFTKIHWGILKIYEVSTPQKPLFIWGYQLNLRGKTRANAQSKIKPSRWTHSLAQHWQFKPYELRDEDFFYASTFAKNNRRSLRHSYRSSYNSQGGKFGLMAELWQNLEGSSQSLLGLSFEPHVQSFPMSFSHTLNQHGESRSKLNMGIIKEVKSEDAPKSSAMTRTPTKSFRLDAWVQLNRQIQTIEVGDLSSKEDIFKGYYLTGLKYQTQQNNTEFLLNLQWEERQKDRFKLVLKSTLYSNQGEFPKQIFHQFSTQYRRNFKILSARYLGGITW